MRLRQKSEGKNPLSTPSILTQTLPPFFPLFVSLDNSQWGREEIKLFAQSILQMTFVGEVQTCLASSREHDERGRSQPRLSKVLNMEPRHATFRRGRRASAARLSDRAFKKGVELRGWNSSISSFIGF